MAFPQHVIRTNESALTGKSSKQTQHVSVSLCRGGDEEDGFALSEEEQVVVVVVVLSFIFKPPSLFSFVLHFVVFLSSCCGGSGDDVAVVVVDVDVAFVIVVVVFIVFPSLSSSFSVCFRTDLILVAAAASLIFLHCLRCPPCQECIQWFTWQSRPQYCTVWHNLQGCNGRNGVLGLQQVEQQRMVGVVRPSYLSKC